MNVTKLLTFEVFLHIELALMLLASPRLTIRVVGWDQPISTFWPRLLGGVIFSVALGILTTVMGWVKDGETAGIGLAGVIVLHLTMAFVIFSMLFLGPRIKAGRYNSNVAPNDIAPTLATILDIETPSGSSGRVLTEMLK